MISKVCIYFNIKNNFCKHISEKPIENFHFQFFRSIVILKVKIKKLRKRYIFLRICDFTICLLFMQFRLIRYIFFKVKPYLIDTTGRITRFRSPGHSTGSSVTSLLNFSIGLSIRMKQVINKRKIPEATTAGMKKYFGSSRMDMQLNYRPYFIWACVNV